MVDQIIQLLYSALFFITPLIMTKTTSELFEFNKILFIYGSTVLISFLWLLKMVVNKKIILKKTPLDIPIVIFFISQLVSTIFSLDRHASIFGYYGRFNGGLLSTICYILLFYGLVSNIVNIEKLLKSIVASSLFVILWAIPGHFGRDLTCLLFTSGFKNGMFVLGKFNNSCWDNAVLAFRPELRAFSTLGQPNWLGAYLAVAFFIGIYFLIKYQISNNKLQINNKSQITNFKNIFASIYLFLNFSMILFTRSRSAIFAVFVGLILFVGYYLLFIKTNFKKVLIILLIVTVIPIILFKTGEGKIDKYLDLKNLSSIIYPQKTIINHPSSIIQSNNVTESFDIRKIVWEGAWELAMKYPLFGTGVETFAYSYNFVRPVTHNLTSEWDYVYNKAHNEYFNYLATTGFVGLGSYLIFIGVFIICVIKKIKGVSVIPAKAGIQNKKYWILSSEGMTIILTLSLFCGWLTILITNFFGFSTTTIQLFFFLIPAFLFMDNQVTKQPTNQVTTIFQWVLISILLVIWVYLLFSITVYYIADVNYSYGLKYSKINDQQKAAGYFERALKLREEPVYMDKFSSSLAYLSAVANVQNQIELAKQIANLSDSYNKKTIQDYPKNIFYWKTRAKNMYYFFQMTGKEDELLHGVEALKNAQKLSPTDPKIPYSMALYYSIIYDITKNNPEKKEWQKLSLQEIDKSIRLKSNYQEAYSLKSELLKKYLR